MRSPSSVPGTVTGSGDSGLPSRIAKSKRVGNDRVASTCSGTGERGWAQATGGGLVSGLMLRESVRGQRSQRGGRGETPGHTPARHLLPGLPVPGPWVRDGSCCQRVTSMLAQCLAHRRVP